MVQWLALSNWAARTLAIPGVKATWNFGTKKWRRGRFKRVFGSTASEYFIAFASLEINPAIQQIARSTDAKLGEFPLVKPSRPDLAFKAQKVVSGCELRALSYLGSSLVSNGGMEVKVVADEEISNKLDVDCVSLGAMSNLKTRDVFSNPANRLAEYSYGPSFFLSKKDGKALCPIQPGFDYGIILKIHPSQFPGRTWIACAGIGEWGTSGASWFLANKWKEIAKRVKQTEQFVCVFEVMPGQDESARLYHFRQTDN